MKIRNVALSAMAAITVSAIGFTTPAAAGPRMAWAQYEIPIPRYACADRANRAMRTVYRWRLKHGKQHVFAESPGLSAWIRCWEIKTPYGPKSIATIVVTGSPNYRVDQLRSQLTRYMRYGQI